MASTASTSATQTWNDNRVKMNRKGNLRVTKATHNCAAQNIGADNSVVVAQIPASSMIVGATLTIDTVEDSAASVAVGLAEDGATLVALSNAQVATSYAGNDASTWIASATNVHLTPNGACDTMVATVRIAYIDLSKDRIEDKA
jgi:hypothetical protein